MYHYRSTWDPRVSQTDRGLLFITIIFIIKTHERHLLFIYLFIVIIIYSSWKIVSDKI